MNKIRTIIIDGVEIQTSLSAVEIADLYQKNQELQKENEKNKHYKTLYQSLKKQKEELRDWLVEQEEKTWDEVSCTFGYVLDKLEELEMVTDE